MLMTRNCKYSVVIFIMILAIFACESKDEKSDSNGEKYISVPVDVNVKATKCEDGPVVFSELTEEEIKAHRGFSDRLRKVEKQFPGIDWPIAEISEIKNLNKLKLILPNGDLKLDDGKILRLAGCECGLGYIEYLKNVTKDEGFRIYFTPSGFEKNEAIYAYIWCVFISDEDDTSSEDISMGPMFFPLNETMVINKWCKPVKQPHHKNHSRYKALSKVK